MILGKFEEKYEGKKINKKSIRKKKRKKIKKQIRLYLVLIKYQGNKKNIKENGFLLFGFTIILFLN